MTKMKFKEYLTKPTLYVFDIDDTLFRTTAKVNVMKNGKLVRSLSSSEFNSDSLGPGEKYDYSEFDDAEKFNKESTPIHLMMDTLKRIHQKIRLNLTPGSKVIMNTARGDFDDKETFLDTFRKHDVHIDDIHVHRAGAIPGNAPTAAKKLVFIRKHLDEGNYAVVIMYDDNKKNLDYFMSLTKEYPDVKFYGYLVDHAGKITLHIKQ